MQPIWKQDSKRRNIQPKDLPQFEAAGTQLDHFQFARAMRMVSTRAVLLVALLALVGIGFHIETSLRLKKERFGQFEKLENTTFRDQVLLTVRSFKVEDSLKGWIFTTTPRKGFQFMVVDVEVTNRADRSYRLDAFGFSMYTRNGNRYNTSLKMRGARGRITSQKLKPEKSAEGLVVFEFKKGERPDSLQIGGGSGTVARVPLR